MPSPNQITACATSSLQGVYVPEVHMYPEAPHPKYGLLPQSFYFKGKTRDRKAALATARQHIKAAQDSGNPRAYLEEHGRPHR